MFGDAVVVAAKSEAPAPREFVLRQMRTSVEALLEGRLHTLPACIVAHYSALHCALNLGLLTLFRRIAPLPAGKVRGGLLSGLLR